MADAEKEKAEKLAAARKRVEQLKKEKQKAGGDKGPAKKKTGAKKKSEKADGAKAEDGEPELAADGQEPELEAEQDAGDEELPTSSAAPPSPPALKSPTLPSGETAQDIYKRQAARISDLEAENKQLLADADKLESQKRKAEDELEELRESNSAIAELKSKAQESDRLKSELTSLQRQNSQLQAKRRTSSSAGIPTSSSPDSDLAAQLASKSGTIESLELEVSNLHNQLSAANNAQTESAAKISSLESSVQKAEAKAEAAEKELADLKANLASASERAAKEGGERTAAETRTAQLEAELSAAQRNASEAAKRAETLEKKVEALTGLHREAETRNQSRVRDAEKVEREAKELRSRIAGLSNENARLKDEAERESRRRGMAAAGDDDGVDELEEEERRKLVGRVRELEEEVFELRRGVWKDKRRAMQPGVDENGTGFDEVDLMGGSGTSPTLSRRQSSNQRQGSSFQDVINSGISAFMGDNTRRPSLPARSRGQSLGMVSEGDDFEFDENAFKAAHEEEGKRRIERIKEVKRGLNQWSGWMVDIVDVRAGMGGVFDV